MNSAPSQWMGRLALAVLGQALPEPSALSGILKDLRRGLLATVIAGCLVSAFILFSCFGLYHVLLSEGVSKGVAMVMGAVAIILIAIISALVAEKYLSRVSQAKEKLALFPEEQAKPSFDIEALASAFFTGFCEQDTSPPPQFTDTFEAKAKPSYESDKGTPIH